MRWTQREITQWGNDTFGFTKVRSVGTRMNKEVAELLTALEYWEVTGSITNLEAAREECADVGIMLFQVADKLGLDLLEGMNRKMDVNEKRVWRKTKTGDHQHGG